ncbi:MAG: InlB B-repeat-containing protein [Treponema sp.]
MQETITLTYGTNGTLKVEYGNPLATAPASGQTIPKNSQVKFTAMPNTGYEVESWEGVTGAAKQNEVTTTATGDLNVKVKFKQIPPTDWKVTFEDIKVEKATETADKDKKRTVTFNVKYPTFTLPNPAPYIDSILTLEGNATFLKDTKSWLNILLLKKIQHKQKQVQIILLGIM